MLMVSRPLLEWSLRQRLLVDPRVELREDASALDLRFSGDAQRVDGVVVRDRDGGESVVLDADLVVDATGRASRTPEWLARRGFPVPVEEVRRVDKRYATRRFVSGPDTPAAVVVGPGPGLPRSGIALQVEGGQHVVSLMGMLGGRPPVEATEWRAYARSLAHPALAELLDTMDASRRGSHLPVPGQPPAALRAPGPLPRGAVRHRRRAVRVRPGVRARHDGRGPRGAGAVPRAGRRREDLSRRFHRRAARHVDTPWTIATGQLPDERGRVAPGNRLFGAYLRMLLRAGADDPQLAHAFARVSHLVDPPTTLTTFARVSRVLTDSAVRRTGAARGAPVVVNAG